MSQVIVEAGSTADLRVRLVEEDGSPLVLVDGVPGFGANGLTVRVELTVGPTGAADEAIRPRIALAHGQDAAGWWIGTDGAGRCSVGVVTTAGPVSLSVGDRLAEGDAVRVVARIPGVVGERLVLELLRTGRPPATTSAMLGATVVKAVGPLVWGGRAGVAHARLPFHGSIADVLLAGDASANVDGTVEIPALLASFSGGVHR